MRRVRRALLLVVTSPPFVGALLVLALAWRAGARGTDERDLGGEGRARAMASFIEARYAGEIKRVTVAIGASAIGIGVALGLVAAALVWARAPRVRRGPLGRAVESLAVVAALHALVQAWGMARAPQLYAATYYEGGGAGRALQVVITDVLGPGGVVALGLGAAFLYARGSWLRGLVSRARARLGPARAMAFAGASAVVALGLLAARAAGGPKPAEAQEPPGAPRASAPASAPKRSPKAGARPNVLVLAADSLRADRLEPRTAPRLSALADASVTFERAYVSLPRTFSSWVTILTGRHAHHHGIRSMFPRWEDRAKDFDALPARLGKAGYKTAVVSDYAGDIFGRIDLGFGVVDTPGFDFRELVRQRALERETPLLPVLHSGLGRQLFPVLREINSAADPFILAEDAKRAIRAASRGGSPFFVTVFFSTAHFPYAAPAPYYAKYTDPRYRGRFKYHKPIGLGQEAPPDAEDVAQIRGLYDGAVRAIDDAAGSILDELERSGLADDTVVVVTADHGEALWENGHGQGHGDHLFGDEGTHVPLVVYDPRSRAPHRERAIVRDVDIAPTLYELTGVPAPADLDGRSLGAAFAGTPLPSAIAVGETELWFTEDIPGLTPSQRLPYPGIMALTELDGQHGDEIVLRKSVTALTTVARHRMARDERYKLVYVPTRAAPVFVLFDTLTDPAETRDVAALHPAEVTRLKSDLFAWALKDKDMMLQGGYLVPREGRGP